MKKQTKVLLIAALMVLGVIVVAYFAKGSLGTGTYVGDEISFTTPESCPYGFMQAEGEHVNHTINSSLEAYSVLIGLETGFVEGIKEQEEYKNSTPNDVIYKKVPVVNPDLGNISLYVLRDWTAIDAQGKIYRRGMCE